MSRCTHVYNAPTKEVDAVDAKIRTRLRKARKLAPAAINAEIDRQAVKRDRLIRCRVCGCTEREPCNPPCDCQHTEEPA